MTNPRAAPTDDPAPPPDAMLSAGLATARKKIERTKTFRTKTTKTMKELVFSKLSNLKPNDISTNASAPAPAPSPTITDTDRTTNSPEIKLPSQAPKIQTNISDLFSKKTFDKSTPEEKHRACNPLSKKDTNEKVPVTSEEQTTETLKDDTTKTSNYATDAMTGVELTDTHNHEDFTPSKPAPSPPVSSSTTTKELTNPITHGTAQEICVERIKFEVLIEKDAVDDPIIHTKALVILGRLVNDDPSRKVLPYKTTDEKHWKPLPKTHDLPKTMESMRKYIADPIFNTRTRRLSFHMRFSTAKPLSAMKQDPNFMTWLKKEKLWLSVNLITTTNNKRVGFFIGKCAHITNIQAFYLFVKKLLSQNCPCPDFQISTDGVGDVKDSTRSRALVIICAAEDVPSIRENLLATFPINSAYPFLPFKAMHNLPADIQRSYYHRQKHETNGQHLVEIPIPNFDALDDHTISPITLREFAFSLSKPPHSVRFDIDNGTRSMETVIRVHQDQKILVKNLIASWLEKSMHIVGPVGRDTRKHTSKVFRLDAESKAMTNTFAMAAKTYMEEFPSLQSIDTMSAAQTSMSESKNPWRKSGPPPMVHADAQTMATTASSFTNSSKINSDIYTLRQNIRKVAFSHKRLEASFLQNFMDSKEQDLLLLASLNNHRERLERLEEARQRQAAINSLHIKLTLDPEVCSRDGTTDKLVKLILQDNNSARDDRTFINEIPSCPVLPEEAEKFRQEAHRNKNHFTALLAQIDIPEGEPFAFGDLTEFELKSDEESENMSKLTDVDMDFPDVNSTTTLSHPTTPVDDTNMETEYFLGIQIPNKQGKIFKGHGILSQPRC